MRPLYEKKENNLEIHVKKNRHFIPHIHNSFECILVDTGSLELGIGTELYHMEPGDFAVVFPGLIHHYQSFGEVSGHGIYLLGSPAICGTNLEVMQSSMPLFPVVSAADLDPDISYMMKRLVNELGSGEASFISKYYVQIILARYIQAVDLTERPRTSDGDLVYRVVSYVAAHFTEEITLTGMASDLYVSPFELSRLFAATFHMNFNSYVNENRLDYAAALLSQTDEPITDIMFTSGFGSQRTFNRVFREKYHMTPREYRQQNGVLEA